MTAEGKAGGMTNFAAAKNASSISGMSEVSILSSGMAAISARRSFELGMNQFYYNHHWIT